MENRNLLIDVTEAPYSALGDAQADDRAAIQKAIDDAAAAGGGTVLLPAGHIFTAGCIVLRSYVTLQFGDGAVLQQTGDETRYVKPAGEGYVPYTPAFGHNFSPDIKWSHNWYHNYPLIFAPAGSHDFAVRGRGVVRMMDITDEEKIIKICPVGFFRCHHFEIADVHITNYHSYAVMPFTCSYGVFRDLTIDHWDRGNGDGICMMNCQHMRVTNCNMYTGDDSVYIFSSYRDPRRSEWWDSDDPQPSEFIEIDHNHLKSNHCKAFGMILWGIECPDPERTEVRSVYVHDNYFESMGNWNYNPYTARGGHPAVTDLRFENNVIRGIESNFFETYVSDMQGYRCMPELQNGEFFGGRAFWVLKGGAGVCRDAEKPYGYTSADGDRVYQGVYLEAGRRLALKAEAVCTGKKARLFVRDQVTDALIASLDVDNAGWERKQLDFTVPVSGNYRVGLEDGEARFRFAVLAVWPENGCDRIFIEGGKILYLYD